MLLENTVGALGVDPKIFTQAHWGASRERKHDGPVSLKLEGIKKHIPATPSESA